METKTEYCLPSHDISYAYAVAMYFAQLLEINLKAFLYAANYHGWGEPIELNEWQAKRFKSTDQFIDKATCGIIIKKLEATGLIKCSDAWEAFNHACEHRNKLAHSFLAEQDFDKMTKQKEAAIIRRLDEMIDELKKAVIISKKNRVRAENSADAAHESLREFMREFGICDYENPNRHYSTKKRKKSG